MTDTASAIKQRYAQAAATQATSGGSSVTSPTVSTIAQYAILALVVVGVIVLTALHDLSATVAAGILGVAIGHGGATLAFTAGKSS